MYPEYMDAEDIMRFEYEYHTWSELLNPNSLASVNLELNAISESQRSVS